MNSLILTKESTQSDIEIYFNGVLKLTQNNKAFPVDFDDIWGLVYERKDHAVRSLRKKFIQDIDFQSFPILGEREVGCTVSYKYYLSVPCMEFFIARKNRNVFEVYRKVFHHVANGATNMMQVADNVADIKATSSTSYLTFEQVQSAIALVKARQDILRISDASVARQLNTIEEKAGLPHSPEDDYTDAIDATKAPSDLLKMYGASINAQKFNKLAEAHGVITHMSRKARGGLKWYWMINEEYLSFGINKNPVQNEDTIQPRYYVHKFPELLTILNIPHHE